MPAPVSWMAMVDEAGLAHPGSGLLPMAIPNKISAAVTRRIIGDRLVSRSSWVKRGPRALVNT